MPRARSMVGRVCMARRSWVTSARRSRSASPSVRASATWAAVPATSVKSSRVPVRSKSRSTARPQERTVTVLPWSRACVRRSSSTLMPAQSQNPTVSRRRSMPLPDSARMSCRSGRSLRLPRSSSPHRVTVIRSSSGVTSMVAMQGGTAVGALSVAAAAAPSPVRDRAAYAGSGMALFSLVSSPCLRFPALPLYPIHVNRYMKRSTCFWLPECQVGIVGAWTECLSHTPDGRSSPTMPGCWQPSPTTTAPASAT